MMISHGHEIKGCIYIKDRLPNEKMEVIDPVYSSLLIHLNLSVHTSVFPRLQGLLERINTPKAVNNITLLFFHPKYTSKIKCH